MPLGAPDPREATMGRVSQVAAKSPAEPQDAAGTTVRWTAAVRGRIDRAARRGYPEEVCGLLLGRREDGDVLLERAVRIPNRSTDRRSDRYVLDPRGFLRVDRMAEERDLEVVGIWHTHPDSPARPSPTDREWAWPGLSYLILSVRDGRPDEWRCWALTEDDGSGFREQTMEEVPT